MWGPFQGPCFLNSHVQSEELKLLAQSTRDGVGRQNLLFSDAGRAAFWDLRLPFPIGFRFVFLGL